MQVVVLLGMSLQQYRVTNKRILGDANLDGGVNELDVEFINSKLEQGETIYLYNWNEWDWNNTDVNSIMKLITKMFH